MTFIHPKRLVLAVTLSVFSCSISNADEISTPSSMGTNTQRSTAQDLQDKSDRLSDALQHYDTTGTSKAAIDNATRIIASSAENVFRINGEIAKKKNELMQLQDASGKEAEELNRQLASLERQQALALESLKLAHRLMDDVLQSTGSGTNPDEGNQVTTPETSPSDDKTEKSGRGKKPKSLRGNSPYSSFTTKERPAKGERLGRLLEGVQRYYEMQFQLQHQLGVDLENGTSYGFGPSMGGRSLRSFMPPQYRQPQDQMGQPQPQGQPDLRGATAPARATPHAATTPPTVRPVPQATTPRESIITPQFTPRGVATPKAVPRVSPSRPVPQAATAPRTSAITPRIVTPTARPAVNARPVRPVQQIKPVQQFKPGSSKPIVLPRF